MLLGDGDELGLGHEQRLDRSPDRHRGLLGAGPRRGCVAAFTLGGPDEAEHHRVHQGLPRGLDDVLGHADRRPDALGVGRVEQHSRHRPGPLRSVEHADAVVGQMHVAQLPEVRLDGEAEGGVEGVDGPVAFGGGDDTLVADVDLDRRFGRELAGRRPRVDERRSASPLSPGRASR